MKSVKIINIKKNIVISDTSIVADRFFGRLRGWIGKTQVNVGESLLLPHNNSIHMWFMRIPIDVVFLREEKNANQPTRYVVTSLHEHVKPWRLLPLTDWKADTTIECAVGSIREKQLEVGDELCFD